MKYPDQATFFSILIRGSRLVRVGSSNISNLMNYFP